MTTPEHTLIRHDKMIPPSILLAFADFLYSLYPQFSKFPVMTSQLCDPGAKTTGRPVVLCFCSSNMKSDTKVCLYILETQSTIHTVSSDHIWP